MTIEYRRMTSYECDLIKEMNPSRFIKRAWRKMDGKFDWVTLNHKDNDYPEGIKNHLLQLKSTFEHNGFVFGAFDCNKLVGFCSVNSNIFGNCHKYLLLDQLFVANTHQDRGIGKKLFRFAVEYAVIRKADKLYICSGSSEDTLAFYRKLGCVEVMEVNQQLLMNDENDIQLEYDLKKSALNT